MSATRFIVCGNAAQEREAIGADRGIVGHHHHVVEEPVDRGLGRR